MVTLVCAALVSTASALVAAPAYPMRAAVRVAASRTAAPEMLIGRSWILAVRKTVPQFPMFSKGGTRAGGIRGADGGDGGIGSTAGSSDDEGDNMPMMQMWKRYEQLLEETPLLMKALTSLTGFALGDILAQKVIQKVDSFDILRLLRLASYGFLVHGTTSHVFYGWLDGKFPGTSAQVVFAKVLVDQVFWAPIFGMMFFSYVAAAELKGIGNVFDKMKDELVTQVTGSWTVWPLAHAINFRIIPSSQRVLYINTIQIGYNCFLSLIANRGLTVAPAPVTSLGNGKKNATAIFVLLIFHIAMLVVGILNWNTPCDGTNPPLLPLFLVIYASIGLLFVYLLFREWLHYARLSSLPSYTNLFLLIVFFLLLSVAGSFLIYETVKTRYSCSETAPLLYRWSVAAAFFFAIFATLFLSVPLVRLLSRCLCAPIALCMIGCVETVGVDVEYTELSDRRMGTDLSKGGGGKGRIDDEGRIDGQGQQDSGQHELPVNIAGVVQVARKLPPRDQDEGKVHFVNPLAGSNTRFGLCCVGFLQLLLAPGCIVPGRSLIALFVNTAALLWFFLFMGFELWSSWEIVCPAFDPGTTFQSDVWGWLVAGAPSPIHWLLLLFVITGLVLTLFGFIVDLFSVPQPPPRSHYEVAMWRGRMQAKAVSFAILAILFVVWGIMLCYFTFAGDDCNRSTPRLYNIALLLCLLLAVLVGLSMFLGCCVLLDCCISGRMKFILLLRDPPDHFMNEPPHDAEQLNVPVFDATLIPGNPSRKDGRLTSKSSYGTQYGTPDDDMATSRLERAVERGAYSYFGDGPPPGAPISGPISKLSKRVDAAV